MSRQLLRRFSILELLIVVTIITILVAFMFVVGKSVKESAGTVSTNLTINACKISMEHLENFIASQSSANSISVYQHPLFSKVWSSNKVWTFRDKDENDKGITSNGLMDMINMGNLGVENKSILIRDLRYPDLAISKTLVDYWGNPLLLMRNETPYFISKLTPSESVTEKVYTDRSKTYLGQYLRCMFSTNSPGKGLYEWNDASFNHIDSNMVNEPSYEIAPMGADGYRKVVIYGKIAVPHNANSFDFFSPGKDGKVGNLIPNDNKQDRWSEWINNNGDVRWVPTTLPGTDPDNDNHFSFNKYISE